MNNIKLLETIKKNIVITFNITFKCNFSCYYCIAGERNEKTFVFNDEGRKKLNFFIESLSILNKDIQLDFMVTGGEPLLNKYLVQIVEFLLLFKNITIIITTNGFLLGKLQKDISIFNNNNVSFFVTFHYDEYIKLDNKLIIILNNINLLKNNKIKFKLNFLIPTDISLYEDYKYRKELIIKKCNLNKEPYGFNLILENGIISDKYNSTIITDYNLVNNELVYNELVYNDNESIILTFDDDTKIKYTDTKKIIEGGLNSFKGYLCFPFSIPTNILLDTNLNIVLAGCTTLSKKSYSIEDFIEYISKSQEKYVICSTDYCSCGFNILIKKKYDSFVYNKFEKFDKIIKPKLLNLLLIKGLDLIDIKQTVNDSSLLISYMDINKNYFLNFVIEKTKINYDYMKIFGGFGLYFYKTNYQGGIINDGEHGLDYKTILIIKKIEVVLPIFKKII